MTRIPAKNFCTEASRDFALSAKIIRIVICGAADFPLLSFSLSSYFGVSLEELILVFLDQKELQFYKMKLFH